MESGGEAGAPTAPEGEVRCRWRPRRGGDGGGCAPGPWQGFVLVARQDAASRCAPWPSPEGSTRDDERPRAISK